MVTIFRFPLPKCGKMPGNQYSGNDFSFFVTKICTQINPKEISSSARVKKHQPSSSFSFSAIALEALPLWLIEFFCSLVIWAVVMPNSGT